MSDVLIYKIVNGEGRARYGEDAAFSLFSVTLPTSTSYGTRQLARDWSVPWSSYVPSMGQPRNEQPWFDSLFPPELIEVSQPPDIHVGVGYPRTNHYTRTQWRRAPRLPEVVDVRGTNDACTSITEFGGVGSYEYDPTVDDPKIYTYRSFEGVAFLRTETASLPTGGFAWIDPGDVTAVFGGTPYANYGYDDLLRAMSGLFEAGHPRAWTSTPVVVLGKADSADVYQQPLLQPRAPDDPRTDLGVRALEVLWHSRLDATAESRIAAMLADRAAALAAYQDYVDGSGVLSAYLSAWHDAFSIGGSGDSYMQAVVGAASTWIAANWP